MKKLILLFSIVLSSSLNAQYCAFYDVEANEPEMVLSTLKAMMDSEWGKNIQGTKSLFQYSFNGTNGATHSVQFCFQNEDGLQQFMMSFWFSDYSIIRRKTWEIHYSYFSTTKHPHGFRMIGQMIRFS